MPQHLSRNAYSKGLDAIERGRFLEALAFFEASMELTRRAGGAPSTRCLSYYGYCIATASARLNEAWEICAAALARDPGDPDLHLNLGRVNLKRGDRTLAFESFVRGLSLDRRHRALLEAVQTMGFRRRPALRFLGRRHPLNRMLGQLRSSKERSSLSSALDHL